MTEWREHRLDEFASLIRDSVDPQGLHDEVFHYAIPTVQALGTGALEPRDSIDSAKLLIHKPCVLYSRLNPRKKTVCIARPQHVQTVCSGEFLPLVPQRASLDYLYYLMISEPFTQHCSSRAESATRSHQRVSTNEIMHSRWRIPNANTQQQIAEFLDRKTAKIDALIAKQEQLVTTLLEHRAAIVANAYPAEGKRTRLRAAIELAQTGPFGTQLAFEEYVVDGVPVINPTHITAGALDPDRSVSVTEEKAAILDRYRLRVGDVVLGRKGEVDKSALVGPEHVGMICGSDSMLLRPASNCVPSYLWWFFQSPEAHSQLEQWAVGSTVAGLNQMTVSKVTLPTHSVDEQQHVADFLDRETKKVDRLVATARHVVETLGERRAALITAAVTGQIDVAGYAKGA